MPYIKIHTSYLKSLMKNSIDGIIVVEGHGDASYISSYFNALCVITNGYEIPEQEIDFLNHLPKEERIIILTDSDEAGINIRKRLNEKLSNYVNVSIDISKCNKNGKHGVAESQKEELIKVLSPYIGERKENNLALSDLIKLGITDKKSREYLSKKLHLGIVNNKNLLKRINYLNIDIKQIEIAMKEYGN